MTDAQLRAQIARPDADIILNATEMAKPGARFEVTRDFQLNEQRYKMLVDARQAVQLQSVSPAFQGREGTARSGLQESTQVEQSVQSLGELMDNFKQARTMVGEQLLAMRSSRTWPAKAAAGGHPQEPGARRAYRWT